MIKKTTLNPRIAIPSLSIIIGISIISAIFPKSTLSTLNLLLFLIKEGFIITTLILYSGIPLQKIFFSLHGILLLLVYKNKGKLYYLHKQDEFLYLPYIH